MKLCENFEWFIDDEITESKQILCPECNEWSSAIDWNDCEPYCEDCGSHAGIECPVCGDMFDHCFDSDKTFKVREIK